MATTAKAYGQITIVDLTDQRSTSFYLQSNQSKIQTYNVNTGTYVPDYGTSTGKITITPKFFFGNEDYSNSIATNIDYYIDGSTTAVKKYSNSQSPTDGYYQIGSSLYVQKNIGEDNFQATLLRIRAVIPANSITDAKTELKNTEIEADIEFGRVDSGNDGDAGISVTKVEQQYILSSSSDEAPREDSADWSPVNPSWEKDKFLWIRTEITYSSGNTERTQPYCDSSWKVAADGISTLTDRIDQADALIATLQKEVDSAIETWYLKGNPNDLTNYPWYDANATEQDTEEEHEGDLYFDTVSGKSYRFFKQDDGNYAWQIITDTELSQALSDISQLQTTVDGKVTIHYGEEPDPSKVTINVDDMWVDNAGNFHQYVAKTGGGYEWSLASYSIDRVEVEYATHNSNTSAPVTGWSTSSPTWEPDTYIWQRSVTYYKNNIIEPDPSKPVCISAAAARGIVISGEQVFKSTDGTNYLPANIVLTAECVGGLTVGKWQYKSGTTWKDVGTAGSSTLSISSNDVAFVNGNQATIRVIAAEGMVNGTPKYYDVASLFKVTDGQKGADGESTSTVFLSNENITFAGDKNGQVAARTVKCNVIAYTGTTKVTPTVGTVTGQPGGMTVKVESATDNEVPVSITIAENATLGGEGVQSGTIAIPITSPVTTTLYITWSKVNTGATGAAGAAGANAIFALVESTNGNYIFTDTLAEDITLAAKLYVGGTVQTTKVTYAWSTVPATASFSSTDSTITIKRNEVPSAKSYICKITYDGKTYSHSAIVQDKTDPIYCEIDSSNGDKFTNGNINTTLTCRVFDQYGELDIDGSKYVYTWEKIANGQPVENWVKTGKSIQIGKNDVDAKAVFSCTITDKQTSA